MLATEPETMRNSMAELVPKVARTDCSNAGSAVSTVTTVLFAAFEELLKQKHYNLVIDLAGVRYVSSAGAGVFMNVLTQSRENGGGLVLINLTQGVREIFELLNLHDVLPIATDLPAAIQMLK